MTFDWQTLTMVLLSWKAIGTFVALVLFFYALIFGKVSIAAISYPRARNSCTLPIEFFV